MDAEADDLQDEVENEEGDLTLKPAAVETPKRAAQKKAYKKAKEEEVDLSNQLSKMSISPSSGSHEHPPFLPGPVQAGVPCSEFESFGIIQCAGQIPVPPSGRVPPGSIALTQTR